VADQSNPTNVIDVLGRTFTIVQQASEQNWRRLANVVIEPNVAQFTWDGFGKTPELIAAGELANASGAACDSAGDFRASSRVHLARGDRRARRS